MSLILFDNLRGEKIFCLICVKMSVLDQICNCSCCDCSKLYHRIFKRKENIKNINPSQIFNRDDLIAARPSVVIPFGGKFESIDYEHSENSVYVNEQIKKGNLFISGQFFTRCFLVILTGILAGLTGAIVEHFAAVINCHKNGFLRSFLIGDYEKNVSSVFIWGMIINLCIAFVGSFIVVFIEPAATGGGMAGAMGFMNGVNVPKAVAFKVYLVKVVSFICMSGAGLPGGKEGIMIHCGAILGGALPRMRIPFTNIRVFSNMLKETDRRDLTAAGGAAGLSASLSVPLGAFLTVLEEFISFWSGDLFFSIFMCSLFSGLSFDFFMDLFEGHLSDKMYAKNLLFLNTLYEQVQYFSFKAFPLWVLIGVFGGLFGALWIYISQIMIIFRRRFVKFKVLQLMEVLFWTVVVHTVYTSLLLYTNFCTDIPEKIIEDICDRKPSTFDLKMYCPKGQFPTMALFSLNGNGRILKAFFHPKPDLIPMNPVIIMFLTYFFMSGLFVGSTISAGLFLPNMISGAGFGRSISLILHAVLNEKYLWWADPQISAFFGSASLISSVTRMTFSLAVLYCEGASNFILFAPMVIVLLFAKITVDILIDGAYEVQVALAGIPFLGRYPPPVATGGNAADVMSRNAVLYLTTPTTVRRLIQVTFESRHNGFPIVDTRYASRADNDGGVSVGRLVGIILRSQILTILKNQLFDNTPPPQIPNQKLSGFRKDLTDILTPRKMDNKPGMNLDANVNLEAIMDPVPFTVKWNTSVNRTYRIFCSVGLRHLIVVNSGNEVVGMITRKDLAKYKVRYNILGIHVNQNNYT